MILNLADISHLKELKAAGEHGRTIRAFNTRLVLDRLAKYGYVAARSTGLELVQYRITKRGEEPSWRTPNDAAIKTSEPLEQFGN